MCVLRVDEDGGEGAEAFADVLQRQVDGLDATGPEVDGADAAAAFDDGVVEEDLAVELERACLHGEGARGGAGALRLVDDADLDAELG